jgi:hypothetical protein
LYFLFSLLFIFNTKVYSYYHRIKFFDRKLSKNLWKWPKGNSLSEAELDDIGAVRSYLFKRDN